MYIGRIYETRLPTYFYAARALLLPHFGYAGSGAYHPSPDLRPVYICESAIVFAASSPVTLCNRDCDRFATLLSDLGHSTIMACTRAIVNRHKAGSRFLVDAWLFCIILLIFFEFDYFMPVRIFFSRTFTRTNLLGCPLTRMAGDPIFFPEPPKDFLPERHCALLETKE